MAASSPEPPPKHVKLRYRALAYVRRIGRHRGATSRRSFADTGGARQVGSQRKFSYSGGPRPAVRLGSRRRCANSGGARPVVRVGSGRSLADSNEVASTPGEIKVKTRSRRTSRARKKPRNSREYHGHGEHRLRLFCGCGVEQDAFDPGKTPPFRWSVEDSYQNLSNSTKFRLKLCGLHVISRNKDPVGLRANRRSVGARATSFDSGFGFTCASPVACPPPLGLVPTRTLPITLQLQSRDGIGSENFTRSTGNSGFPSTGFKRKTPSFSSYPSYTPTTPPSPFMNDFLPAGTFNNTRTRSRVSVGCNGRFLNDDDPAIMGWYRRRSSGEVKAPPILTHLSQVAESSRESDADFDRESTKRYKRSRRVSNLLLGQGGSESSSNGGIASTPLSTPPPPFASSSSSYSSSLARDSALLWQGNSSNTEIDDYAPPTKRRRSTSSSSNSSGGFGFGNISTDEMEEGESLHIEPSLSARGSTSLTARFSESLRLTRSHSPRALKRALALDTCRGKGRRSRNQSASQTRSRWMFHLDSRMNMSKAVSPPTPVRVASRPSIVFIDCLPLRPSQATHRVINKENQRVLVHSKKASKEEPQLAQYVIDPGAGTETPATCLQIQLNATAAIPDCFTLFAFSSYCVG